MSFEITDDANFLGGIDFSDLTRIGKFNDAIVITKQIEPNGLRKFPADERNSFVKSVELQNPDAILPTVARLINVKVNVRGSSTDTDISIHQSSERREIDRVLQINREDVNTTPNTFLIGGGIGTPFVNKDKESQIYFTIDEKSGNTAEYDIEFNWLNIRTSI